MGKGARGDPWPGDQGASLGLGLACPSKGKEAPQDTPAIQGRLASLPVVTFHSCSSLSLVHTDHPAAASDPGSSVSLSRQGRPTRPDNDPKLRGLTWVRRDGQAASVRGPGTASCQDTHPQPVASP